MFDFDIKLNLTKQDRCLFKFSYIDDINFDSHERQNEFYYFLDIRINILCEIMKWNADLYQKIIFWLNNMIDTNKFIIARIITRIFIEKKRFIANFFFSKDRGDFNYIDKFFNIVAIQLMIISSRLKHYVYETIVQNKNISRQSMRDQ